MTREVAFARAFLLAEMNRHRPCNRQMVRYHPTNATVAWMRLKILAEVS